MIEKDLVLRTALIAAGNNLKYVVKAMESDADCVVLDLEDGVSNECKQDARQGIKEFLSGDLLKLKPIFVRINSLSSGMLEKDLEAVVDKNLSGIVYPKVKSSDEIIHLSELLSRKEKALGINRDHFKIIPIIETPLAMLNLQDITFSSKRIIALLLGAEDLLADLEGYHVPGGRSLQAIRTQIALAARAASVIPLDTPYLDVRNEIGLREFIQPAKELGFEGMLAISPSQIRVINDEYTPDRGEYDKARKMVEIADDLAASGKCVAIKNDLFVSAPTLKRARKLIARYERINGE
ncbi:HpcH/HpaI aldolase/citrate lyase family protein [Candidatus Cloacimonadota bacterium]